MSVRRLLENALDSHANRITYKKISEETGVCNTLICRYFSRTKDLTFFDILKVVRYVAPNEEPDIMSALTDDYIQQAKPANVRALLLYLVNAKMYDDMHRLGAIIEPKHRECVAWYELIQLYAEHKQNAISGFSLALSISTKSFDSDEFRTLKNLLYLFANHKSNSFQYYFEIAKDAEQSAGRIKSDFIRESLFNAIYEQFSIAFLYQKADTQRSRFYAQQVSTNFVTCEMSVINSEYVMGVSYMFEDFGKALTHLNSCVAGLRKIGRNDRALRIEQDDIAFLYNYWQVKTLQGSDRYDESQQVYAEFTFGDKQKAQQDVLALNNDPFNIFLKGIILNEDAYLIAACGEYRLKGNEFFANLPLTFVKQSGLKSVLQTKIA
jgi:hypothetical protein